jgi:hypothetical protein
LVGSEIDVGRRVLIFRWREFAIHVAARADLAVGVAAGVDFAQGIDVDVGVDLGGVDPLVA